MSYFGEYTPEEEYEVESGNYVFDDGTTLLTIVDDVHWHSFDDGERFINLRFSVLSPDTDARGVTIKNRKLFSKLYILHGNVERDADKAVKKKDRDTRLLLAIDHNVYGNLAKLDREPTDADLQSALMGKPIMTKWGKWEFDGKSGNWLMGVSPGTPVKKES